VHIPARCTLSHASTNPRLRAITKKNMGSIEDAIAFLSSSDGCNIAAVARKYNVSRSTLSKRFRGKTGSVARRVEGRRLLTNKQEEELVKQIQRLCEWCLPPTPAMVRTWASMICGSEPGKNWSAGFRRRHQSVLDCRYLDTLDLERHKADHHTRLSQGLTALTKRDFFKNFYSAYDRAFTQDNIKSGWQKTGLEPFDPEQVLKIFKKGVAGDEDVVTDQATSDRHSSCCLDSPSAMRTIRRIVSEGAALGNAQSQRLVDKLGNACLTFATELILARERERGFIETIDSQQKKKKRGRPFTEDLRAEEDLGALFFSPSKINRAKALQAAKDEAKELESQNKLVRARDRATRKAEKEAEVRQRREDRAARAAAKKAEDALQKALRQQQKEAKAAQKRLETESMSSNSRSRKRRKIQKEPEKHRVDTVGPEAQVTPKHAMSRSGRIIKKRAYFDDI
jgi:hypothetical protein